MGCVFVAWMMDRSVYGMVCVNVPDQFSLFVTVLFFFSLCIFFFKPQCMKIIRITIAHVLLVVLFHKKKMLSEHNLHLSLFLIQYVLFLFTLFGSFAGTVCYVLFNFLCLVLNDIQVVFRLRLEWTRWSFSAWKCWFFRRFRSYWKAFESPSHTLPVSSKTKYIERKKRKKYASNAFPYVRSSVFITWNMFTFLYKKKRIHFIGWRYHHYCWWHFSYFRNKK